MRWSRLPLIATLAVSGLAACVDNPDVQGYLQRQGASPSPGASGSLSPSGSPAPTASPSSLPSGASASPSAPGRTGQYVATDAPLDVAIAGPGYFVVSARPDPQSMADLLFTRYGHFQLLFVSDASPSPATSTNTTGTPTGPGHYRLVTPDGLYVMGFSYPGHDQTPLPGETRGTIFPDAFRLGPTNGAQPSFGSIGLPTAINTTVDPSFTARGQLWNNGATPVDTNGQAQQIFLAIVDFDQPQALSARSGALEYGDTQDAGWLSTGIAGAPDAPGMVPRPVGDANVLRPNTLEDPGT